ncbi:MAG: hypothetical protein ACKO47_02250, partial [Alphaproteobacteria bacterium]
DKINYKIEGNISRSEIIVPNDKIGKCSLIGSIVSAAMIIGSDAEDLIRKKCHEIIASPQYKDSHFYPNGKCISHIASVWHENIQKQLSQRLDEAKKQAIAEGNIKLKAEDLQEPEVPKNKEENKREIKIEDRSKQYIVKVTEVVKVKEINASLTQRQDF